MVRIEADDPARKSAESIDVRSESTLILTFSQGEKESVATIERLKQ